MSRLLSEQELKEFVVINILGKEIAWVDPVEDTDIRETQCYWYVSNGVHTYRFWKYLGYKYVHREFKGSI